MIKRERNKEGRSGQAQSYHIYPSLNWAWDPRLKSRSCITKHSQSSKKDLTVLRHQILPLASLSHPAAQTMMGDSLGYATAGRSSWVMEDTADCSQRKAPHGITAETHRRESIRGGGGERKLWKLFRGIASAEYFYILLNFETSRILLHVCSMFPKPGGPESQPWKRETWLQHKLAVMKDMPRKRTRMSSKKARSSGLRDRRDRLAFTHTRSPLTVARREPEGPLQRDSWG